MVRFSCAAFSNGNALDELVTEIRALAAVVAHAFTCDVTDSAFAEHTVMTSWAVSTTWTTGEMQSAEMDTPLGTPTDRLHDWPSG